MEEACVGHDYNLHSEGTPKSNHSPSASNIVANKTPTIVTFTSKETSNHKSPEKEKEKELTPRKSPINLDLTKNILRDLKLYYDVVEYLKKMKENIVVFELCKITYLREQLRKYLTYKAQDVAIGNSKATPKGKNTKTTKLSRTSCVTSTSSVENKEKEYIEEKKPNSKVDGALFGRKSRSLTPPFLLNFEIFNRNVHNCLLDIGASSNVIPYSVFKKLISKPQILKTKIIQLDISNVKVLGELKDMLIHLASKSKVHLTIDIIDVDILETYGLILRRYWSTKLNGYFATK
jgi:hypothetical protein